MKNTKHTEKNDSSIEQENQENLSQSKRKILTSIGVTSGVVGASALVPSTWVKPAVNSVILPAHADTSPGAMMTTPPVDEMMTTPPVDDMMTTSPEPEMMGPTIEVVGYPTSGMVGANSPVNYHVSLSDALIKTLDPETGMMTDNVVTVMIAAEPDGSVQAQPAEIMFTSSGVEGTSDGSEPITTVTMTTVATVPAADPGVTVTFTADDYEDVTRMFTIVETGNVVATDVEAEAGDASFKDESATVTVTWTAPDTTAKVIGYIVSTTIDSLVVTERVEHVKRVTEYEAVFKEVPVSASPYEFSVVVDYAEEVENSEAASDSVMVTL